MGMVFVALGVSLCSKADLGVSMIAAPPFVLSEWLVKRLPFFSVGVTEYALQGVLLTILCLTIRRFRGRFLLTFAVAVLYGYLLNGCLALTALLPVSSFAGRWILLLIGDVVTAFGVACFFRTYLPLQVYELFVSEVARHFNFTIPKVKLWFDLSLLTLSFVLALTLFGDAASFDWTRLGNTSFHSIGLGTLVTTAINSPLIALMGRLIDRFFDPTPRFHKLEEILR